MRIGMLSSNYPPHPGGLEVMVHSLAKHLARRHEVVVVASAWDGKAGVVVEDGIEVHRLPSLHAAERMGVPYPMPVGPGLPGALRALSTCEVLHSQGALYACTILARSCASLWSVPRVLTEHVGFVQYRSDAVNAVQRAAWRLIGDGSVSGAAGVVTYNARVQRWLQARHPEREVRNIDNGVDTDLFRPRSPQERLEIRRRLGLPEGRVLVLVAARKSEKKNLEQVLQLERKEFELVVCGWQRGLSGTNLVDLGALPHAQMPDLLGCVDVLLHPASGEGFPLTVQEAMASGLPVALLWDEGYFPAIDREVVQAFDTLEQLPASLATLARDGALRAALGAKARERALSRWSWARTAERYEALYAEALGRSGRHG
jgi:glycosyltransferase involved in cell wall biosynthesis